MVYHYDKDGKVISETDSSGNLLSDYIHANGKLVTKIEPTAKYFYHTDPAGTPLAMTDTGGSVVWRADYKPFGEEQLVTETMENDLRFVGKEKDKETGLLYFGARYMEAMIGRFISPDPAPITGRDILNPQRLNRYSYGLNNPYRYLDPDGKFSQEIHRRLTMQILTMQIFTRSGFSERAAEKVAQGNVSVDSTNPLDNYMHSMKDKNQSRDAAIIASENFKRERLLEAGRLIASGDYERGLIELGRGLHTAQDKAAHDFMTLPRHIVPDTLIGDYYPSEQKLREGERGTQRYLNDFWTVLKEDLKLSEGQIQKIKRDLANY